MHHVQNDVKRTTKQLHLSVIVQTQHFSLFGHIARMPDVTDVTQNRPLWRSMSTFSTMHSYWCLSEKK